MKYEERYMTKKKFSKISGFTLIEMLIVMAIIAILAAIALPSYDYVMKKKNKSASQQFMLDVANREEQYMLDARQYTDIAGLGMTIPTNVSKYYTVTATANNGATPPTYVINAVAVSGSQQDGEPTVSVNSAGQKSHWDR